jgi:hypothetical protein
MVARPPFLDFSAGAGLYPDAAGQWRLLVVLAASLAGVGGSFWLENQLLPWHSRMDATTPGWSFVLSQASAFGFIAAIALRTKSAAVLQSLVGATLLGYAYVFAGASLIDPRRAVQFAHLIFRAVELGLVAVAAMIVGASLRLLLRQRLALTRSNHRTAAPQYGVGDLMFLTIVFAVGMWLVNLFFDHFDRESQLSEILLAVVRALPAVLPWVWCLSQPRLTPAAAGAVFAWSLVVWGLKAAFDFHATEETVGVVIYLTGLRAAAYAVGALGMALLLRGLGFRWCGE